MDVFQVYFQVYIPEDRILKLRVADKNGAPAWLQSPCTYGRAPRARAYTYLHFALGFQHGWTLHSECIWGILFAR